MRTVNEVSGSLRRQVSSVLAMFILSVPLYASPCYAPPNAGGSTDLPPAFCSYVAPYGVMAVLEDAVTPGGSVLQAACAVDSFFDITYRVGGNFGPDGQIQQYRATLHLELSGSGPLEGYARTLAVPVTVETHSGPRGAGEAQSFDTELVTLTGQLPSGDPDFDLLRVTAGSGAGMPSPGHTTLTQVGGPGGEFKVDSFFDITYRIDMQGHSGSALDGLSGTTNGTLRLGTGEVPPPALPPVSYFGLPHTALGSATLTATAEAISVCCLGSSGEDGVAIDLGAAQGFQCDLEPVDWQPGARFSLDGTKSQDDATLGIFFEAGENEVRVGARCCIVFDTTMFVTLSLDGKVVATGETPASALEPPITILAGPGDIGSLRILIADNGVKPGSVNKSFPTKTRHDSVMASFRNLRKKGGDTFTPVMMSLNGGAAVLADTISFSPGCCGGVVCNPCSYERVSVRCWDPVQKTGLRIIDEAGIWFEQAHRPLGQATMRGDTRTVGTGQVIDIIKMANLGGDGSSGVSIDLSGEEAVGFEVFVDAPAAGAWGESDVVHITPFSDRADTCAGQPQYRATLSSAAGGLAALTLDGLDDDCDGVVEMVEVDIQRDGRIVAKQSFAMPPPGVLVVGAFGNVGDATMGFRVINEEGIKVYPKPKNAKDTFILPHILEVSMAGPQQFSITGLEPVLGDLIRVQMHRAAGSGAGGTPFLRNVNLQGYVVNSYAGPCDAKSGELCGEVAVSWESAILPYPDFQTSHNGGFFEEGDDVCLEPPIRGTGYQWYKDGALIQGETGSRLCLANLRIEDSGVYTVTFDDGSKAPVQFVFHITVGDNVPAAALAMLMTTVVALGAYGAATLRRRRQS